MGLLLGGAAVGWGCCWVGLLKDGAAVGWGCCWVGLLRDKRIVLHIIFTLCSQLVYQL